MALVPALLDRITRLVPPGWFAFDKKAPVRNAVLGGASDGLSWILNRQAYVRAQTRIRTATGFWLDLIAWDFFGGRFRRRPSEPDDPFRERIIAEIFRPRSTRAAITRAVTDLTGTAPEIVELWNTGDCGAYDTPTLAYAGETSGGGPLAGYDTVTAFYDIGAFAYAEPQPAVPGAPGVGRWGSYDYPNQMLVTVQMGSVDVAVANCGGFDTGALAYGGDAVPGAGFYAPSLATSAASEAEIYATIARTVAGGNIAWVDIQS